MSTAKQKPQRPDIRNHGQGHTVVFGPFFASALVLRMAMIYLDVPN